MIIRIAHGVLGTFEYFAAHLKPLITYPALKSDVLQAFREVGNVVLTVKALEDVLVKSVQSPRCDHSYLASFQAIGETLSTIQTLSYIGNGPGNCSHCMISIVGNHNSVRPFCRM